MPALGELGYVPVRINAILTTIRALYTAYSLGDVATIQFAATFSSTPRDDYGYGGGTVLWGALGPQFPRGAEAAYSFVSDQFPGDIDGVDCIAFMRVS